MPDDFDLYWLSFCDSSKPPGKEHSGVVILECCCLAHAHDLATGLLPEGDFEMMGGALAPRLRSLVPASSIGRVLTSEEAGKLKNIIDKAALN